MSEYVALFVSSVIPATGRKAKAMIRSGHLADWVSAKIAQFCGWRHWTECTRILIVDQIFALDRIAVIAAAIRGHELGDWRIQHGFAVARCVRCGRKVVVYYSPIQPDMDGPLLRQGCSKDRLKTAASSSWSPPAPRGAAGPTGPEELGTISRHRARQIRMAYIGNRPPVEGSTPASHDAHSAQEGARHVPAPRARGRYRPQMSTGRPEPASAEPSAFILPYARQS